jgi:hypothetical protein
MSIHPSLRLLAVALTLLVVAPTPTRAQNHADLDIFTEPGLSTAGTVRIAALDVAWDTEGTVVAAFVEERADRTTDRIVIRKRGRNDAQFTTILRQDLPAFGAVRDLALAIPRTQTGNSNHDRAYLLVIGQTRGTCTGSANPWTCSDGAFFTHAALTVGASLATPRLLMQAPSWSVDQPLAAHPTIACVHDASYANDYYVAMAYQAQQNPGGNLGPNGLPRGNAYLSVFGDFGATPLGTNVLVAGTLSSIFRTDSALRPSITSEDGNGRWVLAFENHWSRETFVYAAWARDAARNYDANPSLVTRLLRTNGSCTSAAISMEEGQFDLACLGEGSGPHGGKPLIWFAFGVNSGASAQLLLDPECSGDPDIAVRASRAYSVARCWAPAGGSYVIRAFENDRAGGNPTQGKINDKSTLTMRPRAAAFRGDGSRQPNWVNGRSLYGYPTERSLPSQTAPLEVAFVDP